MIKKTVATSIVLMTMAGSVMAASGADWAKYKEMKNTTHASVSETVAAKVGIAEYAKTTLGRSDIAGWNYNNAALDLINEFKTASKYDSLMAGIEAAPKGERKAKRAEVRVELAKQLGTLNNASQYLKLAAETTADKDVNSKVSSNRQFIDFVNAFVTSTK